MVGDKNTTSVFETNDVKPKSEMLIGKHTPPYGVNIQGVGQMVLISWEVPKGVNNIGGWGRGRRTYWGWSIMAVLKYSFIVIAIVVRKQWFC